MTQRGEKWKGWEGRGRPQQQRDSLSVGGIGNICSGLTAGLPPAASCRQLHTTKIGAGPQRALQPTARGDDTSAIFYGREMVAAVARCSGFKACDLLAEPD